MKSADVQDEKPRALPSRPDLPACPIRGGTKPVALRHFSDWASLEQEQRPRQSAADLPPSAKVNGGHSSSCDALCLHVVNDSYSVVLARVGDGGLEVYELGLEVLGGGCNGSPPSVTARRGTWLHVIVADTVFAKELVSKACAANGEPVGMCAGCMPATYRRRDLLIDPRDGRLVIALNSDRNEVTDDGAPEVDFDVVPTPEGVAAQGERCSGPEWRLP